MSADVAREIRYALTDARVLCEALSLVGGKGSFSRQAGGLLIRCPWHEDGSPSCSVRRGPDGTIAVRCHACGATGDALSLVAVAHGLTMRGDDFRQVLIRAAEIGGLHGLVAELETGHAPTERRAPVPRPAPEPERDYPPAAEVDAFWAATLSPDSPTHDGSHQVVGTDASAWATSRGLCAQQIGEYVSGVALARCIDPRRPLPRWATYRGMSWLETGHKLVVPVYDYAGNLRSVRAIRVVDGDGPKRLPPAGHRASGLVQACSLGLAMLRGTFVPARVLVVEGEPDFLTAATKQTPKAYARLGITSGSWCAEIASRIPESASVLLFTHTDDAGDRYAAAIQASLPKHRLSRWRPSATPQDSEVA